MKAVACAAILQTWLQSLKVGKFVPLATGTFKTKAPKTLSLLWAASGICYQEKLDDVGRHIITLHSWDPHGGALLSFWP